MLKICFVCKEQYEGRADKKTCSVKCRMSKMRGRGKKLELVKVKRGESKWKGNCVPLAISHATGLAFQHCETLLMRIEEKKKEGYLRRVWEPVIESLGFVEIGDAKGRLLDEMVLEKGVWYLAVVKEHMVAVRDGEYMDLQDYFKRRHRLVSLWKLRK